MQQISSLYLHYPYCRHLCNYCDFYKHLVTDDRDFSSFHQYLMDGWTAHSELLDKNAYTFGSLNTFYIGGGTPSLWGSSGVEFLSRFFIDKKIKLAKDCEFTLEVNPGSWSEEGLQAWRRLGVNRFSLGIQTLNPNVIKLLDRVHSIDDVYETLSYFNEMNYNYSVDFMLGLPNSATFNRNIIEELSEIIEKFNPPHFSVYILTVKKQYVHFSQLPADEFVESEYLQVAEYLKKAGYLHYEVSNFARPGFESKHNLKYWASDSVAALGPSATGYLNKGIRYKWKPVGGGFEQEQLDYKQKLLESVYLNLRTNKGVDWSKLAKNDRVLESLRLLSEQWRQRGLANVENGRTILTSKGYLVMDGLMDEIFSIDSFM